MKCTCIQVFLNRNRISLLASESSPVAMPQELHPQDWVILIKPEEITVTQSMWEDEDDIKFPKLDEKTGTMVGGDRWGKIERNDPDCLENLP